MTMMVMLVMVVVTRMMMAMVVIVMVVVIIFPFVYSCWQSQRWYLFPASLSVRRGARSQRSEHAVVGVAKD